MEEEADSERDIERILERIEKRSRNQSMDSITQKLNEFHSNINQQFGLPEKSLYKNRLDITVNSGDTTQWEAAGNVNLSF